jgi:hypothetical protein
MSTTTQMSLTKPTVGGDTDQWGSELNPNFDKIDAHDHSTGKGTRITQAGLNINDDLSLNTNGLTDAQKVQFTSLTSKLTSSLDHMAMYVSGSELFWNTSGGLPVQITSGNALTLPPVTGSTSYSSITGSTNINVGATDTYQLINMDFNGANRTVTLPRASAAGAGRSLIVADYKGTGDTYKLGLQCQSGDSIGEGGYPVPTYVRGKYCAWKVISDGISNWMLVALPQASNNANMTGARMRLVNSTITEVDLSAQSTTSSSPVAISTYTADLTHVEKGDVIVITWQIGLKNTSASAVFIPTWTRSAGSPTSPTSLQRQTYTTNLTFFNVQYTLVAPAYDTYTFYALWSQAGGGTTSAGSTTASITVQHFSP